MGATVTARDLKRIALNEVYRKHKDDLASAAYHLLGDMAGAEDVLQDVFVRLARNGRCLERAEDLRAYLVSSVLNRARDVLRRRRIEPGSVGSLDNRSDSTPDPATVAADKDDAARVAEALAGIPAEQREVVVLRTYGQLRFREIADVLGISINTVQSRHRYALEALRVRLTSVGASHE